MTTFLSNYPKANLVLGLFLLLACEAKAQTVTYAEHIAPLIYTHCTSCHREGEIGRFPLTNYQEVMSWATVIRQVTQIRYMPPWQPDPTIHAYATYDNTSNNPHNPNNPITDVTWGESTTEEMFYLSFFFTSYQVGDENIVIPEDTLQLGPPLISALHQFEMPKNKFYPPYPNPTQNGLDIAFKLVSAPSTMRFEVVDAFGRLAYSTKAYYHQGDQLHHLDLPKLANGIYFLRLRGEGFDETRSFFIQH